MPNNFGTLTSALIVQMALALVFAKRPVLKQFATGFSDANGVQAQFGQQVITRTFAVPPVNDFGTGAQDRIDTDVPVTLNKFKEVHQKITVQQYSGTNRDLAMEAAEPIATAIANHIVDAAATLWTPANFTNAAIIKAAGWDYTHLTNVRKAQNKLGTPQGQRFYIGNSDVYGALLNDPLVVAALNNPSNGDAIRTGQLPQVAGYAIDEYPVMPAAAVAANVVAFAGTRDSTVYASRAPKDPREVLPGASFPGNLSLITEPKTGFSVMVTEWIDAASLDANIRLVWMYGVAPGQIINGQLITSV